MMYIVNKEKKMYHPQKISINNEMNNYLSFLLFMIMQNHAELYQILNASFYQSINQWKTSENSSKKVHVAVKRKRIF